jgi:hypothetical protein
VSERPRRLPPEERWSFIEDDRHLRIPGSAATLALGAGALSAAVAAWLPPLAFLAWIDLPTVAIVFLACAWIRLADRDRSWRGWSGLLLAAAAVAVSAAHLLLDRAHPWTA